MEAWLTLPARLLIVLLVGYCAWLAMSESVRPVNVALGHDDKLANTAEDGTTQKLNALPVICAIGAAVLVYITIEFMRFSKFRSACANVEKLGGHIHFDPPSESAFRRFWYSKTTIDLSATKICGDSPQFRHIPRSTSIRLVGAELSDSVLREIGKTRSLVSLDLSETSVRDAELELFVNLPKLKKLLLEGTHVTEEAAQRLMQNRPGLQTDFDKDERIK